MSFTTIGDLSQSFQLRQDNARLKADLQRLTAELSSGRTTDLRGATRGDLRPLASLDRSVTLLAAFRTANAEAALFTEVAQSALARCRIGRRHPLRHRPPRPNLRRPGATRRARARGHSSLRGRRLPPQHAGRRAHRLRGPRDRRPGPPPGLRHPRRAPDRHRHGDHGRRRPDRRSTRGSPPAVDSIPVSLRRKPRPAPPLRRLPVRIGRHAHHRRRARGAGHAQGHGARRPPRPRRAVRQHARTRRPRRRRGRGADRRARRRRRPPRGRRRRRSRHRARPRPQRDRTLRRGNRPRPDRGG